MTNRRTLFAIACLGMLSFGIVLTTLGAVLPSVIERFGIDTAVAGSLFLLMTFGILVGSLVFGPIVDRRGYKGMLLLATTLIIIGLEGIAFAPSMGWLRAAVALIGFGGGIINGGTNALVADIATEGRTAGLSLLGVFFGVGAVGVPFALGSLLGVFSYSTIIAAVGALVIIPLVITALTPFPAPKQPQGFPLAAAQELVRDPVILLMGLMLFLASGMEITVGGWTATFFKEELQIADQRALVYLSLYWLGMMLARIALGSALRRVAPARVLLGCLVIAFVGALLLILTRTASLAAAGVFLLGCGFAASFPVVLGFVGDRYAHLSGTAFSLVIVMALTGGMILPYTTGVLGASYGLRGSFVIVPIALVALASILLATTSRLSERQTT
ncbi:MAG: major facilitator superfamily 1 [Geminicoccaceae bacterium]|jgi:fucose permease|nr:major facilitator superfamily 1 [Geminicoccaceae bacterium]